MNRRSKPTRKLRYAVVGLGHIAQVAVLPAFRTTGHSELVSVVSGDPEKRQKLRKKYHLEEVYSYEEYDRALSQVDAVYLALPNHLHCEYAVRAAQAGVHVLCEKPMAVTEEECREMIDAAEQNGVKLMIAYRLHFEEGNLEAIRLAESGRLGECANIFLGLRPTGCGRQCPRYGILFPRWRASLRHGSLLHKCGALPVSERADPDFCGNFRQE